MQAGAAHLDRARHELFRNHQTSFVKKRPLFSPKFARLEPRRLKRIVGRVPVIEKKILRILIV